MSNFFLDNLREHVYHSIEKVSSLAESMFTDRAVRSLTPEQGKAFMYHIGRAYGSLVMAYEGITENDRTNNPGICTCAAIDTRANNNPVPAIGTTAPKKGN